MSALHLDYPEAEAIEASPFLDYADHSRLLGLSGCLVCTLEPLAPLHTRGRGASEFYRDFSHAAPTILGTSLRGTIRTVLEIVSNGCDLTSSDSTSPVAGPCRQCWACAMFGYVQGQSVQMGRVSFSDAVMRGEVPFPMGRRSSGHVPNLETPPYRGMPPTSGDEPLVQGALFDFTVTFTNLAAEELVLLLYCLMLEDRVRHKVGFAKAEGFGTVEICVHTMKLLDATDPARLLAAYRAMGRPYQEVELQPWHDKTRVYHAGGAKDHPRLQKMRQLLAYTP